MIWPAIALCSSLGMVQIYLLVKNERDSAKERAFSLVFLAWAVVSVYLLCKL